MTSSTTATTPTGILTLRNVLLIDAVPTGVNGLVYLAGFTVLDSLLGPSSAVIAGLGVFMLAYAACAAWLAARALVPRTAVAVIAVGNLGWALASVAVVVSGRLELTTTGTAWALIQAGLVTLFADLQLVAVRRSRPTTVQLPAAAGC